MSGIIGVRESRGSGTIRGLRIGDSSVIDDPIVTQGSDATGDVYYRAASGKLTRLATGADGTVLTSTGVGAVPAFEAVPGGGITHASQWRIYSNLTNTAEPITANWEEADLPVGFGVLGGSITESSGVFTFPSTGYWLIMGQWKGISSLGGAGYFHVECHTTTNDSTYATASAATGDMGGGGAIAERLTIATHYIFDVVATATHKVRFIVLQEDSSNQLQGDSTFHYSGVTFIRLGDT